VLAGEEVDVSDHFEPSVGLTQEISVVNRWVLIVFTLFAAAARRVDASPSCAADCARLMAECRQTRCASVSRRACRDTCRAVTGCAAGGARIRTLATVVTECRAGGGASTTALRIPAIVITAIAPS
jgi:hypothetical protein